MRKVKALWNRLPQDLADRDEHLRPLIQEIGKPNIEFEADYFRALVMSILSQQLAPKASQTIIDRFRRLEEPFPLPASLLKWRPDKLRKVGVSPQKAGYLLALARAWQDEDWRSNWDTMGDEVLIERLTQVKGIGVWTAQMFLIFSLGKPDVLPTGDYGIRRGIQLLLGLEALPLPVEIPELVGHWKGVESVASWYVWQALDRKLLK